MNATVARIVELMFEDLEMSAEVQAIHDEVMNNCQERFEDLVNSGLSEDDATAAVIESLKGMDEVLADYPRKAKETCAPETEASEENEFRWAFAPEQVREVRMNCLSDDVRVLPSEDGQVHVVADQQELQVRLENGVLTARYPDNYSRKEKNTGRLHVEMPETPQIDDVHVNVDDGSFGLNDLGRMLKKLSMSIQQMSKNVKIYMDFRDGHVTLRVPSGWTLGCLSVNITSGNVDVDGLMAASVEVHSTSGNLEMENSCADSVRYESTSGDATLSDNRIGSLRINTTSGDVEVRNREHDAMNSLNIRTTSGDIEGEAFAQQTDVFTISGDVELEGRLGEVSLNTTSGDAELRCDATRVAFRTVSGDVELEFDSDELQSIQGQTVSGDVTVRMPQGLTLENRGISSVSGDVNCSAHGSGRGVAAAIRTMSGDIDIR